MKAPYTVEIIQVDNGGYYVKVGCKTLVYASLHELLADLRSYFLDPESVMKAMSQKHGWILEAVEQRGLLTTPSREYGHAPAAPVMPTPDTFQRS